ncbi:MAG: LAGLIDADG family homing endonuclease [Pyrinomonadaceae bacterium]
MKRPSWKYLAGLIDGEGCIDVQVGNGYYVRPRLRVALTHTSLFLLEACRLNFGGFLSKRKGSGTHQDSVCWELAGYGVSCKVLRNIVNHLVLKREQARLALWMEQHVKGKHVSAEARDAIREELKLMKSDPHRLSEKAQERIIALL